MAFSRLEQVRFGYGVRSDTPPATGAVSADRLIDSLHHPDPARDAIQRPDFASRLQVMDAYGALVKAARADKTAAATIKTSPAALARNGMLNDDLDAWVVEASVADCGFRERLVNFFANRLTVARRGGNLDLMIAAYRDAAIRPHVAGSFPEMLRASAWHPAMLIYLEQRTSVGPESPAGRTRGLGLNENYAREVMELHTMGGTGYTQTDVTQLARLLTGMSYNGQDSTYTPRRAEPGRKTVLGRSYGPGRDQIDRVLTDIALRPETAHSLSFALARHFIADDPPADLVSRMTAAYSAHDGALEPVYHALLTHPAASDPTLRKIRSPQEYMVACLRALNLSGRELDSDEAPKKALRIQPTLQKLGQPAYGANAPIGWPEVGTAWMAPSAILQRISFATRLTRAFAPRAEPADLARILLDGIGHDDTATAAGRAEQRQEGAMIVLTSPDFMRR